MIRVLIYKPMMVVVDKDRKIVEINLFCTNKFYKYKKYNLF